MSIIDNTTKIILFERICIFSSSLFYDFSLICFFFFIINQECAIYDDQFLNIQSEVDMQRSLCFTAEKIQLIDVRMCYTMT